MTDVTYWYQFFERCEELVPIFHSVKFAKCEICGSTQHPLNGNGLVHLIIVGISVRLKWVYAILFISRREPAMKRSSSVMHHTVSQEAGVVMVKMIASIGQTNKTVTQ